ncbi:PREDICTED: natural killer cells antigen CD94 [Condylura cristata]|uniref:natural killer cells antigen CD94 n=1 Tax=Condylura cristata TaxID=143302 RepID=UPI000643446F|nr:PREDICTED: natural killer cells antigen CD94 [Condylura cristata]
MEVDFWDLRSHGPFIDNYFGNFIEKPFPFLETPHKENCIIYSSSNSILDYSCNNTNRYISFWTTVWRWISGILGITCLCLMATLGIVVKNYSGYSSCQENWIGYQCNCYFFSTEFKTWNKSRDFCESQNSTLLQLDDRDELHFIRFNQYFYWIGVTYSAENSSWAWINGTLISQDLFPFSLTTSAKYCKMYSPNGGDLDENCESKNRYICKQRFN